MPIKSEPNKCFSIGINILYCPVVGSIAGTNRASVSKVLSKITELFGGVRDEIDHYFIMQYSVGSYAPNLIKDADIYLNFYLLCIVGLAMRITLLERIGGFINQKAKERAIDFINDRLILSCQFKDRCRLPENQREQDLNKFAEISVG